MTELQFFFHEKLTYIYNTKFFSWAKWMDQNMERPFLRSPRAQQFCHTKTLREQGHIATSAVFRYALYQGARKIENPLTIDLTCSAYSRSGQEIGLFCGL
jgi:hypothetical protein